MSPERELRHLILGAQREGNRRLAALLATAALTPAQAEVLAVLNDAEPLALAEVGQRLICETGSPSRLVDSLVRAGHVDRQAADDDRRRIVLTLTPTGRAKARDVAAAEAELDRQLGELPAQALHDAVEALRLLLTGSRAHAALQLRGGPAPSQPDHGSAPSRP